MSLWAPSSPSVPRLRAGLTRARGGAAHTARPAPGVSATAVLLAAASLSFGAASTLPSFQSIHSGRVQPAAKLVSSAHVTHAQRGSSVQTRALTLPAFSAPGSKVPPDEGKVMTEFLASVPKAELHIHLEGSLEIPMMFDLAARNGLPAPYPSMEDAEKAYHFEDLQSFLDLYYKGCDVLVTEADFYDLTWAYLKKVHSQGVTHVELFFDPQTHLQRNISFDTFFPGIQKAVKKAEHELGVDVHLIMCFLRHLSEASAFDTLIKALPYLRHIVAVGLDSSESGRPPSLFTRVFAVARTLGLKVVAHAGEEGPPAYVWEALQKLHANRIDHGVRSLEDPHLVAYLEARHIGLTVCPLSNLRLQVFKSDDQARETLGRLMETSMVITLNSDDPAYFGGYVLENYQWVQQLLGLSVNQMGELAKNSFAASFISAADKQHRFLAIDTLVKEYEAKLDAVRGAARR